MKLLVATGLYPPEIGGPATHTVLMERELPQYGHEVVVVPFSVSRRRPKIIRHLHYAYQLFTAAKSCKVVFAQDVASVGLPALVVARLRGIKFIVRVPGDYAWEQSTQRFSVQEGIDEFQTKLYGLRVELLRFIQTMVTKNADAVITPSDYFRQLVAGWGVAPENITTIYNGVDLDVSPAPVEKFAQLQMVTAGRLVSWKGFATLIDMMPELPMWCLVIIGDGPDMAMLQARAASNNVTNRVHFVGSLTREQVFGYLKNSEVFVLNTAFESFSYQVVEAMSVGANIVTTNVGSLPELIQNGEQGVLLEPDDTPAFMAAIKSVVKDRNVWSARSTAAKERSRSFSVEQTSAQLHTLISSL